MSFEACDEICVIVKARKKAGLGNACPFRKKFLGIGHFFHYYVFMGRDIQMLFEELVDIRGGEMCELRNVVNGFYAHQIFVHRFQNPLKTFVFAHFHFNVVFALVQDTKNFNDIGKEIVLAQRAVIFFEYFFDQGKNYLVLCRDKYVFAALWPIDDPVGKCGICFQK